MANRPITILGIDPITHALILSDNGNTTANRGDTVTWNVGPNSGVASITSVLDNSTVDVFNPNPAVEPNSTSWQGTVNPNLAVPSQELYSINYTIPGGNEVFRFDPKISVNN